MVQGILSAPLMARYSLEAVSLLKIKERLRYASSHELVSICMSLSASFGIVINVDPNTATRQFPEVELTLIVIPFAGKR